MESEILAIIFNPLRLIMIGLFLLLIYYLYFVQNKYEKALNQLKSDPDNHDYYNDVMQIGREHMEYKRQQYIGMNGSIKPDVPLEELREEAYRLYSDDQIKADIYRVVGRTYL
jgi:hypothetical protein